MPSEVRFLALPLEDVRKMEEVAAETNPRDHLIFLLLSRTGARASEVASLPVNCLLKTTNGTFIRFTILKSRPRMRCPQCRRVLRSDDRVCGRCLTRAPKLETVQGYRERIVPVDREVVQALQKYLEWSKKVGWDGKWLFPSPVDPSKHLSRQAITQVVYSIAQSAGLGGRIILFQSPRSVSFKRVSPHRLRDALATNYLARMGMSDSAIRDLQEFFGHANITTTAKYAKAVTLRRVAETLARR